MCLSVLLGICNPVSLAGEGVFGSRRMSRGPGADVSYTMMVTNINPNPRVLF